MLMLRSIVPAINLENGSKQLLFKFFFVLFTRPASPSGIYGSLPLPLVLLTKTAKKKTLFRGSFAGIHVSSRGIAGFTDQRTAFTRAQSAILQGPDFNLRVERAKNPLFTKLISQKRIR